MNPRRLEGLLKKIEKARKDVLCWGTSHVGFDRAAERTAWVLMLLDRAESSLRYAEPEDVTTRELEDQLQRADAFVGRAEQAFRSCGRMH